MTKLMLSILFLAAITTNAEEMKAVSEALHGKNMVVEYVVLNNGKHILMAKEIVKQKEKDAEFKERQTVELDIKDGEIMSINHGFKCNTRRPNDFIYAVISKAKSKEKGTFRPERAWAVEEKKFKLKPVKPKAVQCKWSPDGESKYPF